MNAKAWLERTESSTYQYAFLLKDLETAAQEVLDRLGHNQDIDKDPMLVELLDHCEEIVKILDVIDVPEGKKNQDEGKVQEPK